MPTVALSSFYTYFYIYYTLNIFIKILKGTLLLYSHGPPDNSYSFSGKTACHVVMLQCLLTYCRKQLRVKSYLYHKYSNMNGNQNNAFY